MTEQKIDADRLLTSHEVGALLQVNPSSINKWVNEGRLAAFRTPGGHRRIRAGDLVLCGKGDAEKLEMVQRLRAETTMTLNWIAERLHLAVTGSLANRRRRLPSPHRHGWGANVRFSRATARRAAASRRG